MALAGLPIEIVTLDDFPGIPEAEEHGRTFAENAESKARHYAAPTGLATVAEDSGLWIDALAGRPGVHSARYPGATYAQKFANLYDELTGHPRPWTARFICSLALVAQDSPGRTARLANADGSAPEPPSVLFTAEAAVHGEIAPAPHGANGFGYDPIFWYPPYGRTLGEVSDAEKLAVSHRGQAFRQLAAWLRATDTGGPSVTQA